MSYLHFNFDFAELIAKDFAFHGSVSLVFSSSDVRMYLTK